MEFLRRHALRVAHATVVAGLLAASAIGARAALIGYFDLNALRLDPLQLEVYGGAAPPPALAPGQRRVVFYGDSRSHMWTQPSEATGFQWVNRGIGRQTTAQLLGRFDADVPKLKPDVIVLQLGVNDLKAIPLFPEHERAIVTNARRNIDALVARSQSVAGEVILVTIFPIGPVPLWRRPLWSDRVRIAVDQLNAHFATLVAPRVRLLSADAILLDRERQLRAGYALDHLHLTPEAYRALNAKGLLPLLRAAD